MIRRLGLLLCGFGLLLFMWIGFTLVWGDPITSIYTRHEQHALAGQLAEVEQNWPARARAAAAAVEASRQRAAPAAWLTAARSYDKGLELGQPIGRIVIPRLSLNMVFVEGTSASQLEKGPGHYDGATARATSLPGLGGVIAIAGHRTTFLHPFLHIDDLRSGDLIQLEMPYGTFTYRVYFHKVVLPTDWTILRARPYEKLVLTACHPLHSASHRYVVFARLLTSPTEPMAR